MAKDKVVITGFGAITPLGLTAEEHWQGLVGGRSGIGEITLFDSGRYPVHIAAEVKGFEPERYMNLKRVDRTSRCTQFAIASARMALQSAQLDLEKVDSERVGVLTATAGMVWALIDQGEVLRSRGPRRIDPLLISKISPSMVSAHVGLEIGARGPNSSLNSACASGSDALGTAMNLIRLGHADVMIAGGSEAAVNPISIASTGLLGALSRETDPRKACRPFDLNRTGFVYGEGAGLLVLESLAHAKKRGAPILAEMAGAGWSFDAYSETAPSADQQSVAMARAIKDAGIAPDAIDCINAHGTATELNDKTETAATKMVFGGLAHSIPMSSNKSMIGHLACAAGAVEAIAAVMTIKDGIIPPTINYETPDPECDLDYVPNQARKADVRACLSNSFGMGGQNCSIVIRAFPWEAEGKRI
jgi:3-oxoacyl-[acyl-carrier-protein] synthase II